MATNLPNVTLTTDWQPIAAGASEVSLQLRGGWPFLVYAGPTAPAAGSLDGNLVDTFYQNTNLGADTVYARAVSADRSSTIAITRV